MRIGCYVQGATDEAFVRGLVERWCPHAEMAPGVFRGSSRISFRREIEKALWDLRDSKGCNLLVVLTDSDIDSWREVKRREWKRVPEDCRDMCVFGVAERNIECWLAVNRHELATELDCNAKDIPADDPSGFVKKRFGMGQRGADRETAKRRVVEFVAHAPLRSWIEGSESFDDFYKNARALAARRRCDMPNELEAR